MHIIATVASFFRRNRSAMVPTFGGASMERQISKLKRDDGNVESAMVLIPLLILFLIGIELIAATNLRNGDAAIAQGEASRRAISGEIFSQDEVIELYSPDKFAHIRVLITHRRTTVPQLVPGLIALMGGSPSTDVKGAAIMEPVN
ncbi:unannotated protein [freshwater metagenome]|uniref:Unannotated protein n=1 Tax=freshwater metagenome TaxID=449393 RepID=A0A6J6TXV3_9ZZZZ|nr:hypothetical protein [Actinomycetota bacterium]